MHEITTNARNDQKSTNLTKNIKNHRNVKKQSYKNTCQKTTQNNKTYKNNKQVPKMTNMSKMKTNVENIAKK